MAKQLVSTAEMPRHAWLEHRRRGIGGSDIAAIAGINPWRSPMAVYLEKIGEIDEQEQSERMYWGTVLEDVIAREFARRTGLKVRRRNAILQHPKHPCLIANIDREVMITPRAILEVKTTSARGAQDWEDERIPDYVMLQAQHYLNVTGYQRAFVAVLVGGQQYIQHEVERDEELITYLTKIALDFWRLVENRTPPAIDGSPASSEVIKTLYPAAEKGKEIALPSDAARWIQEYEMATEVEKTAKERKERAANELKALLGDAETGVIGDRQVRWTNVVSHRLDTKALKSELPDIWQKFAKESLTRRFTIS